MAKIDDLSTISRLEDLADNKSIVHNLHPLSKIILTLVYLIVVTSSSKYEVSSLMIFVLYLVIMIELGDIPKKLLFKRVLVAIPFSLFAGISNIILDRKIAFVFCGIGITYGILSFFSIMIKTILTVAAVLILVATTPIPEIFNQLIKLKVPKIIVTQLLLTYRYISVILQESSNMYTSYKLRANGEKGIKLKDMGIFIGQILLKSFNRAERVYNAMKCRGFEGEYKVSYNRKITNKEILITIIISLFFILFRFINLSYLIGMFL